MRIGRRGLHRHVLHVEHQPRDRGGRPSMILRVLEARDRSQKKKTLLRSMQCILSWKKANMDARYMRSLCRDFFVGVLSERGHVVGRTSARPSSSLRSSLRAWPWGLYGFTLYEVFLTYSMDIVNSSLSGDHLMMLTNLWAMEVCKGVIRGGPGPPRGDGRRTSLEVSRYTKWPRKKSRSICNTRLHNVLNVQRTNQPAY